MAARLRTLPAAIAPVLVGTSLALGAGHFEALAFVAALLGAMFIQVGTNLSNDYSDARRGADTEDRLGPVRVTAGGLVPPGQVLIATYVTFGLACACGIYLIAVAGWELLAVGAASILAGVLYTGGPRPYGYEGLGELFVFLFFGIVAVTGSYFVQVQQLPWQAFVCAIPVGLLASAILVVNNVRDLETDRRAGKRTLAVRLGRERTRGLYAAMLAGAFLVAPLPWLLGSMEAWLLLPWLTIPLALALIRVVRTRVDGPCAERGARPHRPAAAVVLRAVLGRDPRQRRDPLMRFELSRHTLRLRSPLHTSFGTVHERELLTLTLTDERGVSGFGEAAPLEAYDGVSLERAERALEHYRPLLEGAPAVAGRAQLLDGCRAIDELPAALAAVDVALWDLAARRAGRPLAELLCEQPARRVPVNATVTAEDRVGAAEQAAAAAQAGFGVVKVKVGVGDDAGRLAAVRAAVGPSVGLRVDANGAWSVPQAVAAIGSLEAVGLELVEEPTHGLRERPPRARGGAGPRGDRRDRGRAGSAGRGRRRRGLPEALALRRHQRAARGRHRGARLRRRGVPDLGPRRTAGRGRRRACRRRPARRAVRSPTAGWRRWRCSRTSRTRCRRGRERSRSPTGRGWGSPRRSWAAVRA